MSTENEPVIIPHLQLRDQNESLSTGSGVYHSSDGLGRGAPETEYDASLLKGELKDGGPTPAD